MDYVNSIELEAQTNTISSKHYVKSQASFLPPPYQLDGRRCKQKGGPAFAPSHPIHQFVLRHHRRAPYSTATHKMATPADTAVVVVNNMITNTAAKNANTT